MNKLGVVAKRLNPAQLGRRDWLALSVGAVVAVGLLTGLTAIKHARVVPLKPTATALTITWLPDTVKRWDKQIVEMSQKYNIDPDFLAIIMTLESGGYAKAQSEAGAQGLMQVTPPTAKDIADRYLKEPTTNYDLTDPRTNVEFGAAYLALLRNEFGERVQGPSWNATVELVAAGYNGGPGAANRLYKGIGLTDTQTVVYSRDAFNMWRERHAKSSPTYERWLERGGSRLIELAQSGQ